jgi:hypothetical protein
LNTTLKFWTDLGKLWTLCHFQLNFGDPFRPALYREYRGNIMSDVYLPCNQSINTKLSLFSLSRTISQRYRHTIYISLPVGVNNFIIKIESVKIVYWFINNYLRKKERIVAFYHLNTTSGTFQERSTVIICI